MPPKIVLIDDEDCIRVSVKWFLEELSYDVVTATDPSDCDVFNGHECSKDSPCGHALIINHNLPKMNAIDFIELMIQRGCKGILSNMLVISGNTSQVDMEKATALGCTVAQKPVSLKFIKAWLENLPIIPTTKQS